MSVRALKAIVLEENRGHPYAIHDGATGRAIFPESKEKAVSTARRLIAGGSRIDAGLAQINSDNWSWLGLSEETVFDPCRNLAAAERLLVAGYDGKRVASGNGAPGEIARLVRKVAPTYALDPSLVLALIEAESGFNPKARSPEQAQGLMQLIPATAARFGVRDVWGFCCVNFR